MNVLVDARAIVTARGGIARYIIEIARSIGYQAECQLSLAMHSHSGLTWPSRSVREWVIRIPQRGRALEAIFRHAALPLAAQRCGADVLWQPSFATPQHSPCPMTVTVHDLAHERFPDLMTNERLRYTQHVIKNAVQYSRKIIAVSQATADDLNQYYSIEKDRIHVVHHGVSEAFRPINDAEILQRIRSRYRIPERYFLFVGTLERRKNIPHLIRSYAKWISGKSKPQALVISGRPDNDYAEICQTIRDLQIEEHVHLLSYTVDTDLPLLYAGADAFVYPSIYEGFGLPVLEAMACGTPVICANTGSLPEIAAGHAMLIDPCNEDSLIEAFRKTADGINKDAISRSKRIRHARNFTWERSARQTMSVLKKAATA